MKKFNGRLDGINIYEIVEKIDYKKTAYEDRLAVVENILDSTNFFTEYFDEHYNPHINNSQELSENEFVCATLEKMATYLLLSDDVRKSRKDTEYSYINKKTYLNEKINREPSFEVLNGSGNGRMELRETVSSKNYLLCKGQKITAEDLKDKGEMGEILRQYQKFIDMNRKQIHNRIDRETFYLHRNMGGAKDDMLKIKSSYKGTIDFINVAPTGLYSVELPGIDFTDIEHVIKLLAIPERDLAYDDLSLTLYDFNCLLKKTDIDNKEWAIIDMLREGCRIADIAKAFESYHIKITRTIRKVAKKVVDKQKELLYNE